jgi:hypothetical protein
MDLHVPCGLQIRLAAERARSLVAGQAVVLTDRRLACVAAILKPRPFARTDHIPLMPRT